MTGKVPQRVQDLAGGVRGASTPRTRQAVETLLKRTRDVTPSAPVA
jgi:hypothetical protein